ncbi:MAG TPA: HEAT repeat domain-containing protein, partial [Acidimicrobiales bacterium]|nr:HEAT repeat domain-containing protein [Acidimicrobiales bacterium]
TASLLAVARDDDALVVEAACWALGERGQWVPGGDELATVVRSHPDARCREAALGALGAIGDARGLQAVLDALEDKPTVRRRAAVALAAFEGPAVESALARCLQDRDWQVREAAETLLNLGPG